MPNFMYHGQASEITLPELDFSLYTFRQENYRVHQETQTVPLLWDENLSGVQIKHPMYSHFCDYLKSLPLGPGYIQTAILIKLPAGKKIPSHVDKAPFFRNYHRIHIPIITNPDCLFTVSDETIHMKPFEIWEIDNDNKMHSVVNNGNIDRIHLLIDFCSLKLRLSTHNRFLLFDTFDKTITVIKENEGIYYGSFGDYVTVRGTRDLLKNYKTNVSLVLPSTFTHDLYKYQNTVYIADCGHGGIVTVDVSKEPRVINHIKLFTEKEHINTVYCDTPNEIWCLLHNLGKSKLVKINSSGLILETHDDVGYQSHGLVKYPRGVLSKFLILSSGTSELLHDGVSLWKDTSKTFLKGLCVHGDIAFFGIAPLTERMGRGSKDLQCEVAAFDLVANKLLWRHKVQTNGLLNSITIN